MDFDLSDDQRAVVDAVAGWLPSQFPIERSRAQDARWPADFIEAATKQGWFAIGLPEELGGAGLGLLDVLPAVEAMAGALAPSAATTQFAAGEIVRATASTEQQHRWLTPLLEGGVRGAVSRCRIGGAWDSSGVGVVVDDSGRLSGDGGLVLDAPGANMLVVAASVAGGTGWYAVPADGDGLRIEVAQVSDLTASAGHVILDGALGDRLGDVLSGPAFEEIADRLTLITTADLVGVLRSGLDILRDHLGDRRQFGKPIGSFQAVQHELAELYVDLSLVSDGLRYAAHAHDAGLPDAGLAAGATKAHASALAKRGAEALVQFHGAMGFTWEHDAHLYFKRLHRDAHEAGDSGWHLDRLAERRCADAR